MELQQVWFVIVGVLFLGFFVLEGFDFRCRDAHGTARSSCQGRP